MTGTFSRSIIGIGRHTYYNIVLYSCTGEHHIHLERNGIATCLPREWSSGHYLRRIDDIQACSGPFK